MFPPGDQLVETYQRLQERFGGNEVVIAVYRDPQLWDASGAGIARVESLSRDLSQVEGVAAVLSLAELHHLLDRFRSLFKLVDGASDENVMPILDRSNAMAQALLKVFSGTTHQGDSPYAAVACMLDPHVPLDQRRKTIAALRNVMQQVPSPAEAGVLAGEPIMVNDGFDLVERDGARLGFSSTVLLSLVLAICFRSIRWTLIPLLVVQWSLVVTQALLVGLQLELTMVSSMLSAIVTVIGVATCMHLLLRFHHLRAGGLAPRPALRQTMSELVAPIALACITDAVGFLALMAADVGPVRDFGLMMALGAMVVLIAIVLLVPGMAVLGEWDSRPHVPQLDKWIRRLLSQLLEIVLKHRRLGLVLLVTLTLVSLQGGRYMRVETDFTKNFYPSSPLVQGYQVVEGELGGAGVWDVMLPVPSRITPKVLSRVLELQSQLETLEVGSPEQPLRLSKVLSLADGDRAAVSALSLPLASLIPPELRLEAMRSALPEFSQALLNFDAQGESTRWMRIMLRSREQADAPEKMALIELVERTVAEFTTSTAWRELFAETPPAAEVTGYHVMLSRLVDNVLKDQWKCFLLATLGIWLVVLAATRSLFLAVVALVPNALPIVVVLGIMGWLGFTVNIGAAMIAAVSMGLSVDNSIHYLLHYQRELRRGADVFQALHSAQENVGLAVILATIALIAGFLALAVSEFIPTVVFGTLTSLTMLGGLFGNLMVLPLLIAGQLSRIRPAPS